MQGFRSHLCTCSKKQAVFIWLKEKYSTEDWWICSLVSLVTSISSIVSSNEVWLWGPSSVQWLYTLITVSFISHFFEKRKTGYLKQFSRTPTQTNSIQSFNTHHAVSWDSPPHIKNGRRAQLKLFHPHILHLIMPLGSTHLEQPLRLTSLPSLMP